MQLDPLTIKLLAPVAAAALYFTPTVMYKGSENYIKLHNKASNYISIHIENALGYVGLQPKYNEQDISSHIKKYANTYNIPPALLDALVNQESAKNSDAYSIKGAIGLAQIMPFNAKRCGHSKVSKLWDEETNIKCGAQILSEELITAKGDLRKALFAYNGGSLAFKKQFPESLNYANKIISAFAQSSMK